MEKQLKNYMPGLNDEVNSEVLDKIEQHGQSPSELFGDRSYPDGVHFKQINGRVQPDDDDDDVDDEEEDDLILGDEDELDEDDLNEDDIDVELDDDLDDEDFDEDDLVLGDDDDEDEDEDTV
jgi:ribonuclease E